MALHRTPRRRTDKPVRVARVALGARTDPSPDRRQKFTVSARVAQAGAELVCRIPPLVELSRAPSWTHSRRHRGSKSESHRDRGPVREARARPTRSPGGSYWTAVLSRSGLRRRQSRRACLRDCSRPQQPAPRPGPRIDKAFPDFPVTNTPSMAARTPRSVRATCRRAGRDPEREDLQDGRTEGVPGRVAERTAKARQGARSPAQQRERQGRGRRPHLPARSEEIHRPL